jgi:CelD/BcsL family acetyltransferase involved in cellulose biosynthesis
LNPPLTNIEVTRIPLPGGELPEQLKSALIDHEAGHYEFGLDWLQNLAAHGTKATEQAHLYIATDNRGDFVALPLIIDLQAGTIASLSSWYTSLFEPVVAAEEPAELFAALFEHLARKVPAHTIKLSPLDATGDNFRALKQGLAAARWRGVHQWHCFANWYCPIEEQDFGAYLQQRPSQVRNTLTRKTKRFGRNGRGKLVLVRGPDNLNQVLEDYTTVYTNSWKPQEPTPQFVPQLIKLAANRGWLRLGIAYYDDQAVATQLWLVHNDTAHIFKLAYHQDYSQLSPGSVLTGFLMQQVIDEDKVSKIDYLSGDDHYKRDWMTLRQDRYGLAAYSPGTLGGVFRWLGYRGKKSVKRLFGNPN